MGESVSIGCGTACERLVRDQTTGERQALYLAGRAMRKFLFDFIGRAQSRANRQASRHSNIITYSVVILRGATLILVCDATQFWHKSCGFHCELPIG
jgi:hypothetical protein